MILIFFLSHFILDIVKFYKKSSEMFNKQEKDNYLKDKESIG
jgi:hypothetical protein